MIVLVLSCLAIVVAYLFLKRNKHPLPPGPPRWPLLGSVFSLPRKAGHEAYYAWSKKLDADIIYFDILGSSVLILNSFKSAKDLLEQRSNIYSSRPPLVMLNELMETNWNFGLLPYGDTWNACKRFFHQGFRPSAISRFRPLQLKNCYRFLRRLHQRQDQPIDVMEELRFMSASTILSITYGLEVTSLDDPILHVAESFSAAITEAGTLPITFLLDSFPVLRYTPEWFPGGGFKRKLRDWLKRSQDMTDVPYALSKRAFEEKSGYPSMVATGLEQLDPTGETGPEEKTVTSVAASTHAGANSTDAVISSFILSMIIHPEIQQRAHQEIDEQLKRERLPNFDDQDALPYVSAIIKESLRFQTITPLGVPHYIDVEDVYNGYRIPAKTTIFANLWAMHHDENIYPDPFTYNPDRYLKDGKVDPDVVNPEIIAFGFGRRACPGKPFGLASTWIAIASILAMFEIRKAKDGDGNIMEPTYEYKDDLLLIPLPFKCAFVPRYKGVEDLLPSED